MFDLPAVGPYQLANPPLAQALAQVRFPLQARLGTLDGIAQIQERLSETYPYLDQQTVQNIEVQFGPDGGQAGVSPSATTFAFSSDDGHSVVLAPDSATLSAGSGYLGVEDFASRFASLLEVLSEVVRVPRCDRLGVRYLTVATTPPGDSDAWARWFVPDVVGWPGGGVLNDAVSVTSAITQVNLVAPPVGELAGFPADVQAFIRHGLAPAGSAVPGIPPIQVDQPAFLMDLDVFVLRAQSWDAERLLTQFRALHTQIDRFFRWSLTSEGQRIFGLEERE